MFKFLRKKKIDSKYSIKDFVSFHTDNDFKNGIIMSIRRDESGTILYDIQVGGECPSLWKDIREDKIVKL